MGVLSNSYHFFFFVFDLLSFSHFEEILLSFPNVIVNGIKMYGENMEEESQKNDSRVIFFCEL